VNETKQYWNDHGVCITSIDSRMLLQHDDLRKRPVVLLSSLESERVRESERAESLACPVEYCCFRVSVDSDTWCNECVP